MGSRMLLFLALILAAGCAADSQTVSAGGKPADVCRCPCDEDGSVCECRPAEGRPELVIPYIDPAPRVDGELDDAAWAGLPWIPLEHPFGRLKKSDNNYGVKLGWNYKGIFIAFRCDDTDIRADKLPRDGALWSGDSFEVFFDPQDRGATHYEIAVNPRDSYYDYLIMPRHPGWEPARVTKWDMEGFEHVTVEDDEGWLAELFVPFSELLTALSFPPQESETWRGHLGVMDKDEGSFTAANVFPIAGAHDPASYGVFRFSRDVFQKSLEADRALAVALGLEKVEPGPVDLSGMQVSSVRQGGFRERGPGWFSGRGYGMVAPLADFLKEREAKGRPGYREIFLPGVWTPSKVLVVHPADFEDPVTLVDSHCDPVAITFKAAGRIVVFYRKSPVTLPEGSTEYTTKGDGVGVSLLAGGEAMFSRWTRSAAWRAVVADLGEGEKEVVLQVDSGPASNSNDYAEIAVYRH